MNIIAIDPSLNCTALVVNNHKFVFINNEIALTKKGTFNKWFEFISPYVNIIQFNYNSKLKDYSENEIQKLLQYDDVTNNIIETILAHIDSSKPCRVIIEGYSFSSNAGPLIDLVTFSTLLRNKLFKITDYIDIISPTTLKLESAKFTYDPIIKGKKVKKYEYRNRDGLAGGAFTKREMFKSLIENQNYNKCDCMKFMELHQLEILTGKYIPKPIDDIIDAITMFEIIKNDKY